MAFKDNYNNTHCGTKQADRLPAALGDDFIRMDERSMEDLLCQTVRFAQQVTFHDDSNSTSTWQEFFNTDPQTLQKQMEEGDVPPHMALMLAFTKLYGKEQAGLNTLLRRHREFYYKEVLGFAPRKGSIGTVPVCFQLLRTANSVFIPKGTLFDAGKDAQSRPIYYATTHDVTLSKAQVSACLIFTGNTLYDIDQREQVPRYRFNTLFQKADHIHTELYLRLSDSDKAAPLSIHFQMNPFATCQTSMAGWSYYDGKKWIALTTSDVVMDTTDGLCRSGIVVLNIPRDKVEWLKASFTKHYDNNMLQHVRTQVAELAFDSTTSQGMPPIGSPLPAGSVTRLKTTISGIKKVMQPYDGNSADYDETQQQFECRVSELLRHKGRAWTSWDYERLVLERFPRIASVQCYPAHDRHGQLTPGSVLLVVIPQLDACPQADPLFPKVDATTLSDIEKYLKTVCPAHVRVIVSNPTYMVVKTECTISLRPGYADKEHHKALLNAALKAFLAPWTETAQTEIGQKRMLNESDIAAFIKQQPYVDKIWQMHITMDGEEVRQGTDIRPSAIGCLLTSANNHEITIVSNDKF